jgi:hypothetical protein
MCWNASENKCVNISNTMTPPTNQTNPGNVTVSFTQIYNYSALHSFDYKLSLNYSGQPSMPDLKSTIASDSVNGTAAWLQQTDIMVQGNLATTKTWFDKNTLKCLKATTSITIDGNVTEVPSQCAAWPSGPESNLTYTGRESVTVPFGTYTANKYYGAGFTYWSASSVPLPLKIVYSSGPITTTEELVSYT